MDMYSNSASLKPVIHSIKKIDKTASDNKTFQQELKELADISEAKTKTAIDSIIVAGIETPLDTASITSRDERESIYSKPSRQKASTILLLNKGKRPQAQDFKKQIRDKFN